MSPTLTPTQVTPSSVQVLQEQADRIFRNHAQLWADFRALPQEEQDKQNHLFWRISGHIWGQYGQAVKTHQEAQGELEKAQGLKRNQERAAQVLSQTCMGCFEIKAANGTCGC